MGNVNAVGPNECLVVSGGCCRNRQKYTVGGWSWSWWCVSSCDRISLRCLTLNPHCEGVETQKGVPLNVQGVAQVRVMYNKNHKNNKDKSKLLERACEHFLGMSAHEIRQVLQATLEGHLRSILGQMTVEEIFQDRERFADQVQDTATPDLGRMGIEIVSFVIQGIQDEVSYLSSIGKAQTAVVLKEATIGSTNALRDAVIAEAQCKEVIYGVKMGCDTLVDNARREYETEKSKCNTKIFRARREAELAYDLQKAIEEQTIRDVEIEVEIIERRKMIEVEQFEVIRKERQLESDTRKPAEFLCKKIQLLAEGDKVASILVAEAEAKKIRLIGLAEASAIESIGSATANSMKIRAEAMHEYGREAIVQMILETLPALTAEICSPLSKIDEIVLLSGGGDGDTGALGKLLAEAPVVVKALTGVDVSGVLRNLPGAQ